MDKSHLWGMWWGGRVFSLRNNVRRALEKYRRVVGLPIITVPDRFVQHGGMEAVVCEAVMCGMKP